jgi:hypothetical protein
MSKAERLMHLVNLIRQRGPVSVSEMAGECGVTTRTIYRDINALSKLNFPVYYDNGYRFAHDVGFPVTRLAEEDMELIYYCLGSNPLCSHPFFRRRFRFIERKLRAKSRRRSRIGSDNLFWFGGRGSHSRSTPESTLIARFISAIGERRMILVRLTRDPENVFNCVPLVIKLVYPNPLLIFTSGNIVIEEPVSNILTIRISSKGFTSRPMHLLRRRSPQKAVDRQK